MNSGLGGQSKNHTPKQIQTERLHFEDKNCTENLCKFQPRPRGLRTNQGSRGKRESKGFGPPPKNHQRRNGVISRMSAVDQVCCACLALMLVIAIISTR